MKRVILCRPNGPRNVGAVVRLMANFGPCELYLVQPMRKALFLHPEFEQMAHGVEDFAERAVVVGSLSEALAACTSSVAFTARIHHHRVIHPFGQRLPELQARASDPEERLALIFGNEANGLSGDETALARELCHIETGNEHGSLNLASAVAIVMQSLYLPTQPRKRRKKARPLKGADLEFLIANVRQVLVDAAWTAPAKREIASSVERVLRHAELETRDARAWHQAMRALGSLREPKDYGILPEQWAPKGSDSGPSEGGAGS